ncbi:LacI family DNA-binding transcriptional regulator [Cerasicoccus maritimus]|uniref:LacI family DNA-binding transcriptional regulator n=1 Tax=Cerasicoccus maritimus TaxID=490089 RepID=UPI0028524E34|nr:LacI family DNA-binding transcriptional regulator [Cerasicoccus maritimus]
MSKIPSIREIAVACGYHNTTVSRALRNKPNIPEATKIQILKVAKEMGWRPNPMASAYLAHRYATREPSFRAIIAWIIPYEHTSDMNRFHELGIHGATKRASALGYSLEKIWLRDIDFNGKRLHQVLKARGIPGLIFNNRGGAEKTFATFDWEAFAIATWAVKMHQPHLHLASYHHAHGIRLALEKLFEFGYKRIAMMLSEETDRWAENAFYQTFFYVEKHSPPDIWMRSYRYSSTSIDNAPQRKRIAEWILRNKPEVILGQGIVWEALQDLGWRIPEDVAFVSPYWSKEWPEIGGVNQQPDVIGANAVDLVATQLLQNERGVPEVPKMLLNEGAWVDAKSIPPRSDQKKERPGSARTRRARSQKSELLFKDEKGLRS